MSSNLQADPHPTESAQDYRQFDSGAVSALVRENVLVSLDRLVWDGVKAFPRRGLEIGGILTGTVDPQIRVAAIYPLSMAYRSSPAFRLSPADLLSLKQSAAWAQAAGESVIGHFRSDTSGTPAPADADEAVVELLNLTQPLLVLIPASAAGIDPARLYRRENGAWVFLLEFPLAVPQNEGAPSRTSRLSALAGRDRVLERSRSARWWAAGGLLAGLGCGVFAGHSLWPSRTPVPNMAPGQPTRSDIHSDINLEAHPEARRLRFQWNPVLEGSSGMLTVHDGGHTLQIPLNRQQLESGNTIYYPETASVEARLEIYRDENHFIGESIATKLTGVAAFPDAATSLQAAKNPVQYVAAVPIRKVRPAVPASLRSKLPESVSVEVKVQIDAAGKVTRAAPVGDLTDTQKLLAPGTVEAARLWSFEPARRNGQRVESESTLKFDFERQPRY
ncbi:MAG: energy transducer TonB [Acidobacteriia bacterium]|nr:energy transducer TonB [Terriglobia bacterium]